ncbi:hypothetical protein B0H16DRAFT_1795113 [Mycena metata]|uniref:Uncharacterized protein n=1 Tax=Mycena metata TaxID=1033252 RepID=A0AAD7HFY5_9AGAR|nr:hypothetical protein B0H16DRAFT_1795113 [Mycena metata]
MFSNGSMGWGRTCVGSLTKPETNWIETGDVPQQSQHLRRRVDSRVRAVAKAKGGECFEESLGVSSPGCEVEKREMWCIPERIRRAVAMTLRDLRNRRAGGKCNERMPWRMLRKKSQPREGYCSAASRIRRPGGRRRTREDEVGAQEAGSVGPIIPKDPRSTPPHFLLLSPPPPAALKLASRTKRGTRKATIPGRQTNHNY